MFSFLSGDMILASLAMNVLVLLPVCLGLLLKRSEMNSVFGPASTAREILLSIYIAILLVSLCGIFTNLLSPDAIVGLFVIQIIYKLLTVVLIQDKRTPVLWFNLGIAGFHAATLFVLKT